MAQKPSYLDPQTAKPMRYPSRVIRLFILINITFQVFAQTSDTFNDGNFTSDPAWVGNVADFTVNGNNMLQLQSTTAGVSYLAFPMQATLQSDAVWEMRLRLAFAPSASNYVRYYLVSNTSSLTTPSVTGYYLQIGEAGAGDVVELFRQKGTARTSLGRGLTTLSSSLDIKVRTTRSRDGQWRVFVSSATGGVFGTPELSVIDTTMLDASFCGWVCTYTISNRANFFLDDVHFEIAPDTITPQLRALQAINLNTFEAQFSEPIACTNAIPTANIVISNGIGQATSIKCLGSTLRIQTARNFAANESYQVTIAGIADPTGNWSNNQTGTLTVQLPTSLTAKTIGYKALVINEIMADINPPPAGLPLFEYLELQNTTDSTLNLDNLVMRDGASKRAFPSGTMLQPKQFLVITGSEQAALAFRASVPGIHVISVSGLGLTDAGELLVLANANGSVIDSVRYNPSWHPSGFYRAGGWALECADPLNTCLGFRNWSTSTDVSGGTPGKENTIKSHQKAVQATVTRVLVTEGGEVKVGLSGPINKHSARKGYFQLQPFVGIDTILVNNAADSLLLKMSRPLTLGVMYTLSGLQMLTDCYNTNSIPNMVWVSKPIEPMAGSILLNEIYPKPTTNSKYVHEFVELYNTTNQVVSLEHLELCDATKSSCARFPKGSLLAPKSYVLCAGTSSLGLRTVAGNTFLLTSFPSLNDASETLYLQTNYGIIIDQLTYASTWFQQADKANGGWSLERKNPTLPCSNWKNWEISTHLDGATPGFENSVYTTITDSEPPYIYSVVPIDSLLIALVFSENMNKNDLRVGTLQFTDGLRVANRWPSPTSADTLYIQFKEPLQKGMKYGVKGLGLKDCANNSIKPDFVSFGIGSMPNKRDLVINEIFADETPSEGLPASEYMELFNTSNRLLDLSNVQICDASTCATIPRGTMLSPKSFLVLCATSAVPLWLGMPVHVLGVPSFPSLNSDSDQLRLVNPLGITIESVQYENAWFQNSTKAQGGWSLERIDPNSACTASNNWAASENPKGGTPGGINSVVARQPDVQGPHLQWALAASKDTIELYFNELIDSISATSASFMFNQNIEYQVVSITSQSIKVAVAPPLNNELRYLITISGITDCMGNQKSDPQPNSEIVQTQAAVPFDVVVNEILSNPHPTGTDFIELYNRSGKTLDLLNWKLASVDEKTGALENVTFITTAHKILKPGAFIVCSKSKTILKNNYTRTVDSVCIDVPTMPPYNDASGNVVVLDAFGRVIDSVYYSEKYHHNLIENQEGISLEKINPDVPANEVSSWQSAAASVGYATPGFVNSQATQLSAAINPIQIDPVVITPDGDGYRDFATIQYRFEQNGLTGTFTLFDMEGMVVRRLARNQVLGTQGLYIWNGDDESGKRAPIGYYMLLVEVHDTAGHVKQFKDKIIVGGKL